MFVFEYAPVQSPLRVIEYAKVHSVPLPKSKINSVPRSIRASQASQTSQLGQASQARLRQSLLAWLAEWKSSEVYYIEQLD